MRACRALSRCRISALLTCPVRPRYSVIDPLSFGKKKDDKTRLPQLAANNGQRRTASFGSR